ncbi:protein kinase domain-containing protein [Endozoicomonas euniceicola]|uniref:Protein kinase n=1 Tax=Endozoicomonas euniceicola TaxID=1234143 RepID=A0ABY6GSW5_9GAMM|nr:protein kinase [Endozoicomonas euniceicola]UYM15151.1 protein kinase [Endozoicomonas euniceicola]
MLFEWTVSLAIIFSGSLFPVEEKRMLEPMLLLPFVYIHSIPEKVHQVVIDTTDLDYFQEPELPSEDEVLIDYEKVLQEHWKYQSTPLNLNHESQLPDQDQDEESWKKGLSAPARLSGMGGLWFPDFSHLLRQSPDGEQNNEDTKAEENTENKQEESAAGEETQPEENSGQSSVDTASLSTKVATRISQMRSTAKRLGSGCYGEVFLGTLNQNGERIRTAAKIMKSQDRRGFHNLDRERRWLKALDHPGVVKLITYESDGVRNLVIYLEYLPYDYYQLIVSKEPTQELKGLNGNVLSEQGLINIFFCLHEVLEYLHQQNIIYFDLHSGNLRFTESGTLKLIDFGVLLRCDNKGVLPGAENCYHLAPEIRAGKEVTIKGQLFSFGLLMIQLLHNKHIEKSPEVQKYIDARRPMDQSELLRKLVICWGAEITSEYESLLDEIAFPCCESDPDDRPDFDSVFTTLNSIAKAIDRIMDPEYEPAELKDHEVKTIIEGHKKDVNDFQPAKKQRLEHDQVASGSQN